VAGGFFWLLSTPDRQDVSSAAVLQERRPALCRQPAEIHNVSTLADLRFSPVSDPFYGSFHVSGVEPVMSRSRSRRGFTARNTLGIATRRNLRIRGYPCRQ